MANSVDTSENLSDDLFEIKSERLHSFHRVLLSGSYRMNTRIGQPRHDYWSFDNFEDNTLVESNKEGSIILNTKSEVSSSSETKENVNSENSENLISNIFRGRDFIPSSENWSSNEIIKARIVNSDDNNVYLDCIIDMETMCFEHRQFPKSLFLNFKTLKTNDLALIKIKSKPGSFRIDVYPGDGMVDSSLFSINDEIQELKGKDLGAKLREW